MVVKRLEKLCNKIIFYKTYLKVLLKIPKKKISFNIQLEAFYAQKSSTYSKGILYTGWCRCKPSKSFRISDNKNI